MFIKETVRGMRDILPREMEIREFVLYSMKKTYASFGYSLIETPHMEHIENLTNKQGGENEKLIFKILKRGEKLVGGFAGEDPDSLVDAALRYDLTVPLARYYANNSNKLTLPFKAMQIGPAFRADRPQKGRFRQFTQCDIDIIGDPTNNAEIELIYATSMFLDNANVKGCTVMINDRRILRAMATKSGFMEEDFNTVFIILDKYDKIGFDGIKNELKKSNFDQDVIKTYISLLKGFIAAEDRFAYCSENLSSYMEPGVTENLQEIIDNVNYISDYKFKLEFDPTLVRGMSYYTGVIFEIRSEDFKGASIAGGGRYDEMIGKYTGQKTSACGFSIGFERMISALLERENLEIDTGKKICVLYAKDITPHEVARLQKKCQEARKSGVTVLVQQMKKNINFQIQGLTNEHYSSFHKVYNSEDIDNLSV